MQPLPLVQGTEPPLGRGTQRSMQSLNLDITAQDVIFPLLKESASVCGDAKNVVLPSLGEPTHRLQNLRLKKAAKVHPLKMCFPRGGNFLLLTTSGRPTRRVRSFCKDLVNVIPGARKFTRGKMSLSSMAERMRELNEKYIAIVSCWKGNPGSIRFFILTQNDLELVPPIIFIARTKLQREYGYRGKPLKSLAIIPKPFHLESLQRLAQALSRFTGSPVIYDQSQASEFEGALLVSSTVMYEAEITFTIPPLTNDVGPSFVVKRLIWRG